MAEEGHSRAPRRRVAAHGGGWGAGHDGVTSVFPCANPPGGITRRRIVKTACRNNTTETRDSGGSAVTGILRLEGGTARGRHGVEPGHPASGPRTRLSFPAGHSPWPHDRRGDGGGGVP